MKIMCDGQYILSPARKMRADSDSLALVGEPRFLSRAAEILGWLREQSPDELKNLCIRKLTCVFIKVRNYAKENFYYMRCISVFGSFDVVHGMRSESYYDEISADGRRSCRQE